MGVLSVAGAVFAVRGGDPRWLFVSLPFTLIVFFVGRYAPTAYRLAGDGVHVERRAGPRVIPYQSIRTADREPRQVRGLTVFGSRGLFGRFGHFWNMPLGHYRLWLSNPDGVVWLATTDGWVGLSPDRPDEFVARLRERLPRDSGR
ncbi:MAG: PH domain-containing protein [Candidatus Rokuibacteriota bacterium]